MKPIRESAELDWSGEHMNETRMSDGSPMNAESKARQDKRWANSHQGRMIARRRKSKQMREAQPMSHTNRNSFDDGGEELCSWLDGLPKPPEPLPWLTPKPATDPHPFG
jgi:hypothetical protein